MNKQNNIEKCIIDKSWVTGTESLIRATAGTDTLITTAARNGGMVEWAVRGERM